MLGHTVGPGSFLMGCLILVGCLRAMNSMGTRLSVAVELAKGWAVTLRTATTLQRYD